MSESKHNEGGNFVKIALVSLGAVLVLGGAIFAAYRYSQSKKADIVLPGGVTYLGNSPTPAESGQREDKLQPSTAPLRFTADSTVSYKEFFGTSYPFSFKHPNTLPLVVFVNDPSDSVGISWGNIPPQQNIMLNVEKISDRDAAFLKRPKQEYVENWYKFWSGLKGVASVVPFTNVNGMKGYKAQYINYADQSPNLDVFFEVPGRTDIVIHMANGILEAGIFDRIVDSVKWNEPTTTP